MVIPGISEEALTQGVFVCLGGGVRRERERGRERKRRVRTNGINRLGLFSQFNLCVCLYVGVIEGVLAFHLQCGLGGFVDVRVCVCV